MTGSESSYMLYRCVLQISVIMTYKLNEAMSDRTNTLECKCDQSLVSNRWVYSMCLVFVRLCWATVWAQTTRAYARVWCHLSSLISVLLSGKVVPWRSAFPMATCHNGGKYGKYSDGHKHRQLKYAGPEWESLMNRMTLKQELLVF